MTSGQRAQGVEGKDEEIPSTGESLTEFPDV